MELNKVCWIGGSARSGKTTISNRFADANIHIYHTDDIFIGKTAINKDDQPLLWKLQNEGSFNIMRMPIDDVVGMWIGIYKESFSIVKNEIVALQPTDTIIVEGICLLPDLLHANGISNACFLISPQAFFEEELSKLHEFQSEVQEQDEAVIIRNNIYDLMKTIRTYIENKAYELSFRIIPVDDEHTIDNNAKSVADFFSLPLRN